MPARPNPGKTLKQARDIAVRAVGRLEQAGVRVGNVLQNNMRLTEGERAQYVEEQGALREMTSAYERAAKVTLPAPARTRALKTGRPSKKELERGRRAAEKMTPSTSKKASR